MNNFSISVVIPATDESAALKKTVDYINNRCAEKIDKTIIVISRKASQECVAASEDLKNKYPGSVLVSIQTHDGLGCAAIHGLQMVNTTHMTFFPADLAIELDSLDRMIAAARINPEKVIKSSRWLEKGSFIGYSKSRFVLNQMAQLFLKILFFSKLTDLTNPVQVIPTNYEKNVIWKEKGFCTLIEHTIMPVRLGYVCLEVPAKCYPRTEGSSKNSAMRTALYMKTVLRVRFTPKSRLMKKKK